MCFIVININASYGKTKLSLKLMDGSSKVVICAGGDVQTFFYVLEMFKVMDVFYCFFILIIYTGTTKG